MNREMREVERWNDPAAAFLTVSTQVSALGMARRVSAALGSPHTLPSCVTRAMSKLTIQKSKKSKSKGPRYQVYKGSWSENRFGIRPGCRWDGVGESSFPGRAHLSWQLASP